MTMKSALLVLLVGVLPPLEAQEQQNDWLLVPGERAGPVRTNISETDLERLFGPANVVRTTISLGEGNATPGTRLC
jgi:hypothetical protein